MQHVYSADRRRRLWLINNIEKRSVERFHDAASALAIASDTEADRVDVEQLHRQMFAECGAKSSTRLRVELSGAKPMTIMMNRPYLVVGSDANCDLRLNHDEIKPKHAFLQWINGQIFCCDIAPVRTLFPDRNSLSNGKWLSQQSVSIGPYQVSLDSIEISDVSDESPLDRSQELAEEMPHWGLQFDGVEQSENTWPVDRTLTMIGRGSQCKLRLNHAAMAIVHACLLRTSMGCWIIDISGDGTTIVNGRPVRVAQVDIGDCIQLGPFRTEVVTRAVRPVAVDSVPTKTPNVEKPLPPIRFDRNPSPPLIPAVPVSEDLQPQTKHDGGATRYSQQEFHAMLSESIDDDKDDAPINDESPINTDDFSVADFIHQQQSQLTLLKSRLDKLTEIYNAASGQLISKRMRDELEAPVVETMKSYDAMQKTLSQLIRSVEDRVL